MININSHKGLINGFNFSDISPGYHDLMFLVFKNPDDYYVNITYLNPATNNTTTFTTWNRDVPVNSLRFNIICMNEEKPSLEYGHIPNNHSSSFDYSSMFVTREPLSSYPWTFQNTLGNEIEPYYINIVNSMRDDVSYVIIQLLDYNQVPLDYNGQDDVYYGKIELNESCSIPATILTPEDRGVHELLVLIAYDPYENIEIAPGIFNPNVTCSTSAIRIGINISDTITG